MAHETGHQGGAVPPPLDNTQVDPYNFYNNPYANTQPTDFEYNPFTGSYVSESTGQVGGAGGPSAGSGLSNIAGGIFGLIGSKQRIQDAENEYNKASQAIEDFYSEAEGKYDRTLNQNTADAYNLLGTRKTNIDPILANQARQLNVLESADTRALLTGLGTATDSSSILAAREADFQNRVAAQTSLGAAEQNIADSNLQRQYELDLRKLGYSEEAARTAAQNKVAEEQARRQAGGQIGQGLLETGMAFFTGENGGKMNFYKQGGRFPDHSGDGDITQKDILMEKGVIPKPNQKGEYGMKVDYQDGGAMKYQMGGGMPGGMNPGVLAQIMGGGGQPQGQPPVQGPFPGEASHETNPIHMINNEGEKVGEAMGGEVMLNDKQGSAMMENHEEIKNIISEGREPSNEEWMGYYELMESILGQPQFKGAEQMMA